MKEDIKTSQNNTVHLQGYINGVRMNETQSGRTAINLNVATQERYQDKDQVWKTRNSFHDVTLFTDDKETIAKFGKIAKDIEEKKANAEVKDFKPVNHTISLDGTLVNSENKLGDQTYRSIQVIAKPESVDLDAKKAEKEVSNKAVLAGNIASVYVDKEKKFAVVALIHNFRPEGSDKEYKTSIDVRLSGDRKFSKETYDKLANGELGKGDFVRVQGQLHNTKREGEAGTRYGVTLDATGFDLLAKKAAKKEEVKEEKKSGKKAAPAPKPEKKAKSNKKAGIKM